MQTLDLDIDFELIYFWYLQFCKYPCDVIPQTI